MSSLRMLPLPPSPGGIWGHPQPEARPCRWRAFPRRDVPVQDASRTDGEREKRGQMRVLARGKPPGSGQSLPNKQSHSDERLIAIVFLFSKSRTPIPRAQLKCGTGWLCLVAVRSPSACWSRLTEAQSQEYLFSLPPPTHERTAGCRRLNTPCEDSGPCSRLSFPCLAAHPRGG